MVGRTLASRDRDAHPGPPGTLDVVGAVLLAVAFAALLGFFAAAFLWQERRGVPGGTVVYGMDDAVAFVWARLSAEMRSRLGPADVRRILEWELRYLQDPGLRGDEPAVVGGRAAAAYAQERLWREGRPYELEELEAVSALQAEYLAAIGAIAGPVEDGGEEG